MKYRVSIVLGILFTLAIWGCSKEELPDPKSDVIEFFGKNMPFADTLAVLKKLDVPAIVEDRKLQLASDGDTTRARGYTADTLLADLMPGGILNERWLKYQIIVSEVTVKGDSALVEISFVDPDASVQYYNKIGLYLTEEKLWKIYSFRTLK
ncbi:MAG: hypothetical protein L0Y74_04040 [candidate division Zixibacteria bacterium]|nr:hypothetical protein [candidate division Zixibacteria bacterium]